MISVSRAICIAVALVALSAGAATGGQIDWDAVPDRTRAMLVKAQQELNEQKYEQAIKRLSRYQQRHPRKNHFLIDFNLGTAYGLLGEQEQAIVHLERATRLEAAYAPLWLNLGKLYYQARAFEHAADALRRGFDCSPRKDPEVLFMAMAASYQAGNMPLTIELGQELVTTFRRDSIEVVSLLANAYLATEDYSGAVAMLRQLLGRTPGNPKIWKLLTQAYFKDQQYQQATVAYEIASYLQPFSRQDMLVMGDLFTMVGVPLRAGWYYEQAVGNEGTASEFEKMAVAYYSAYDFDRALWAIDMALKEGLTSERLLLKAQLYYLQEDFPTAQELYASAARQMSKDGHEWLMAGYCAMRSGDTAHAREWLERATEFETQRHEATAMLKILEPAEDIRELMQDVRDQVL